MIADMSANTAAIRTGRARVFKPVRRDRLAVRLARLYLGLGGLGVSLALMVRARLGLGPRDVLHQGTARHLGLNGLAAACCTGAGLGPGPGDGLMTGIAARRHWLRAVRTLIELPVLVTGSALGVAIGRAPWRMHCPSARSSACCCPGLAVKGQPGRKGTCDHD